MQGFHRVYAGCLGDMHEVITHHLMAYCHDVQWRYVVNK